MTMDMMSPVEFKKQIKDSCIALTGGIATGKSTVAAILRTKGFTVIDADQIAREIVKAGQTAHGQLVQTFGKGILLDSGELDRGALRSIVMSDPKSRQQLEAITHPAIQREFQAEVEKLGLLFQDQPFFYEAALIYEVGRENLFRAVWVTFCSEETQIGRLCNRLSLPKQEAEKIISSQMPSSEKASRADLVINTDCSLNELNSLVENSIKSLATKNEVPGIKKSGE